MNKGLLGRFWRLHLNLRVLNAYDAYNTDEGVCVYALCFFTHQPPPTPPGILLTGTQTSRDSLILTWTTAR